MALNTNMRYRFLGRSGLQVSEISLGGWLTYGGKLDQEATNRCMLAAYEAGINFFDTAEVYSGGQSEIAMGNAIKTFGWKRSDLVISTKIYWGGKGVNDKGLSRKHIIEGMTASLKRLQLDYVDLVYAHRPDRKTPMDEIVRAFNYLINTGKAFYWGTSEWSAQEIQDAHRVAEKLNLQGPSMEQPEYNMFHRTRVEVEYATLYENHGLGTTIWSPLASGILTGKYNDGIPADSRLGSGSPFVKALVDKHHSPEGRARIEKTRKLVSLAESMGCSASNLALAWCLKNPNVSSVITGSKSPAQIEENVKAVQVQDLITPEIMGEIDEIMDNKPTRPHARYP